MFFRNYLMILDSSTYQLLNTVRYDHHNDCYYIPTLITESKLFWATGYSKVIKPMSDIYCMETSSHNNVNTQRLTIEGYGIE